MLVIRCGVNDAVVQGTQSSPYSAARQLCEAVDALLTAQANDRFGVTGLTMAMWFDRGPDEEQSDASQGIHTWASRWQIRTLGLPR